MEFLPQEQGFGSGMAAWRRLRDWNAAGVWRRLHETLLAELHAAGALDWSRARTGSKHHLITEAHGIPLQVSMTGDNRNDVTQLMPLIEAIPTVRGRRGRPRRRPDAIYADRGYDHDTYREQVRAVAITRSSPGRGEEQGSGLRVYRWVVEQRFALLRWFRRHRVRWEIRDDVHEAFLRLACAIICFRRLVNLGLC
jgi:transposase